MRNLFIFAGFLLLITAGLSALETANEQRLVGTWTDLHGQKTSLVFNTDGTMVSRGRIFDGFLPTHWAAAGDRLLVFVPGAEANKTRAIRYFNISSDGKTLIISTIAVEGAGETGSIGAAYKKN